MFLKILLVLSCMSGVAACSDPPPESGYVVRKVYDDPDDWTTQEPIYQQECGYVYGYNWYTGKYDFHHECNDKKIGERTVPHHDGPHWEFRIKDDADAKGKRHGWVEVDETTYNNFDTGMHWPDPR